MMKEQLPLVILSGPTAVGKTETSIELAKRLNGEIISADSMQVYKKMDIGTAKIMPEEMKGIRHHLIDILEPDEDFNVLLFQQYAKRAMDEIYGRGHIPIIAGGTGFYIQAVLYGIAFEEHGETTIRKQLEQMAKEQGGQAVYELLRKEDPETAQTIHPNNVKKVIRALEFFRETGKSLAVHNEEQRKKESQYRYAYFVLNRDRKQLYERINRRVDRMMEQGLLEEVKSLMQMGIPRTATSMAGLGYKEILKFYDGACTLEEAVDEIKLQTRHFAKRQLTWFRREKEVCWIEKESGEGREKSTDELVEEMMGILRSKGIVE